MNQWNVWAKNTQIKAADSLQTKLEVSRTVILPLKKVLSGLGLYYISTTFVINASKSIGTLSITKLHSKQGEEYSKWTGRNSNMWNITLVHIPTYSFWFTRVKVQKPLASPKVYPLKVAKISTYIVPHRKLPKLCF